MMAEKTLPWADWEIVRRLGGGSYGTVYEIRRERYGIVERAAMKVISFPKDAEEVEDQRRSGFTDESLVNSYRQQMQRFLDEYRLMLELKGKTNIVSCDDFQTVPHADGIGWDIFIKMELLTPLKKYLAREITPEQTVKLGIDLCKALSLCREKDIIHRDIKPDNILVSDSGDFKLGDFGVAKTAERTMAGTRTGTPNFTAPEVYHNEPYGKSVDIYSLGMVLYWMLNRRALPFLPLPPQMPPPDEMQEALLRRMRGEALPRPVDGSRALQDVVLRACAYDPADRYATPEEFCRALEAMRAADTSTVDSIPDAQPVAPAAEPSFPDADATMGNNWETEPQAEMQPDLTDFDATDATMGTCGEELYYRSSTQNKCDSSGNTEKNEIVSSFNSPAQYNGNQPIQIEREEDGDLQAVPQREEKKRRTVFLPWIAVAACFLVVIGITLFMMHGKGKPCEIYGSWSEWGEAAVEASDMRQVESKVQYSFRTIDDGCSYSQWGPWGDWSSNCAAESDIQQVESKILGYSYSVHSFVCSKCGYSAPNYTVACVSHAYRSHENAEENEAIENLYAVLKGKTGWDGDPATISVHTNGYFYGEFSEVVLSDGDLAVGERAENYTIDACNGPVIQYRVRTRTIENGTTYSDWSPFQDDVIEPSDNTEVKTRIVYRYRERK